MQNQGDNQRKNNRLPNSATGQRQGWKGQTYVVPSPSRRSILLKASALHGLQRFDGQADTKQPVTVVVPALFNLLPAEVLALGWLNEIDSLATIRNRMTITAKLMGWDPFTFHTRHNLDTFYDSTIKAVQETWLDEGALHLETIAETRRRFGPMYDYYRIEPRLVENLLIQSSLMDWLTVRASGRNFRFHVIGTGLLSALVWSGALPLTAAIRTAAKIGMAWDAELSGKAETEIKTAGASLSEENIGWRRFHLVRRVVEGRAKISLSIPAYDLPQVDGPSRPFWYSATAKDEPLRIETPQDVRTALESMNFVSWSPDAPGPLVQDRKAGRIRGWLISPMHPMASACHWSMYNYLLATPSASLLFLDHIAALGPVAPLPTPSTVFKGPSSATYRSAGT